jgi:hypothetical protein
MGADLRADTGKAVAEHAPKPFDRVSLAGERAAGGTKTARTSMRSISSASASTNALPKMTLSIAGNR